MKLNWCYCKLDNIELVFPQKVVKTLPIAFFLFGVHGHTELVTASLNGNKRTTIECNQEEPFRPTLSQQQQEQQGVSKAKIVRQHHQIPIFFGLFH